MSIAIILFTLGLSALFSGSEIAFISANKLRMELLKKKGGRKAKILAGFFENPSNFLGVMLVGNNIALVVFTALATPYLDPLTDWIAGEGLLSLLLNTVLITIVVLIFGEFLPKTLFRLYANEVLVYIAYPLRALQWILVVPASVTLAFANYVIKLLFKAPVYEPSQVFTRLDLEELIMDPRGSESEEEIDKELFGKALNFRDVRVRDCMVPRTEIEYIDVNADLQELEQLFRETKLSRIIVVENDVNNVLGYVHHQQLLKEPKSIGKLILQISFVPEVMRVSELLNRFIKQRTNIACVVDEFGGIAGLITLEDILEELFGEIEDEHDQEEYVETRVSEREFIFSGRLEIDYLNDKYEELSFPEGDYHTLSGYLVTTVETIPEQGAEIYLDGYRFILELVSDTKIETIRVIKLSEDTSTAS
ncbi:MAG: hemolysin family protein [Saprospiraceae bacterium]|jgi:putative hemolysin|nr:hemolysin family protein [Saprospiraceae bacterium]MDP4820601.1 hemolysin family protein [Saprospiraceae bacterium]MDP5000223.1 hemolysin family protein [Saprospiraceae bacterium]